jgi:rhamnosyltransferase subunit B
MARIVVTSAAYLGDVAPFVPAANELARRGHDVTFLAPAGFHSYLSGEEFAVEAYPLDFSAAAMHADPEHERLMRHPWRNQARLLPYWMRKGFLDDPDGLRDGLLRAFTGADVVVTHPTLGSVSTPVARHLGVPVVVGQLFPMMVPTAEHTLPLGSRSRNLGALLNRSSWALLRMMTGVAMGDRAVNAMRAELGLSRLRGAGFMSWLEAERTVMLVSPHYYGEPPADWPSTMTWGGFSMWRGPASHALDPRVDDFLDAGAPPVLVTLGTSAATGAGPRFAAIGRRLDALGLRSLHLVADERNLEPLRGRDGVFVFAPIADVIGRCRAAVVSGALGAVSTALLHGTPVVVVPQLFDQLWHGRRVEDLGVGRMAFTPKGVASAVAEIEADAGYRERARALAARMASENGAVALADTVESVVA